MIYTAVKTEAKAKEILISELKVKSFNITYCKCECGQTALVNGYDEDFKLVGQIAVCDGCGEEDFFYDEVIVKHSSYQEEE